MRYWEFWVYLYTSFLSETECLFKGPNFEYNLLQNFIIILTSFIDLLVIIFGETNKR